MLLKETTYIPPKDFIIEICPEVDSKEDNGIVSELTSSEVAVSHKLVLEMMQWKCSQIFIFVEEFWMKKILEGKNEKLQTSEQLWNREKKGLK